MSLLYLTLDFHNRSSVKTNLGLLVEMVFISAAMRNMRQLSRKRTIGRKRVKKRLKLEHLKSRFLFQKLIGK